MEHPLGKPKIDDMRRVYDERINEVIRGFSTLAEYVKLVYNTGRLKFEDSIVIKQRIDTFMARIEALKTDPNRYDILGKRNYTIADDADAPVPKNLNDLPRDAGMKVLFLSIVAYFNVGYTSGAINFDSSIAIIAAKNDTLNLLLKGA